MAVCSEDFVLYRNGNLASGQRIAAEYEHLCIAAVRKFHADQREDLAQEARIALLESALRYDVARGIPFEHFARRRLFGAVRDAIRVCDPLSRQRRQAQRRCVAAAELEYQHTGVRPAVPTDIKTMQLDFVPRSRRPAPELSDETMQLLRRCLGMRDALIVVLYWVEDLTCLQIGRSLGLSESRVHQITREAIARARSNTTLAAALAA